MNVKSGPNSKLHNIYGYKLNLVRNESDRKQIPKPQINLLKTRASKHATSQQLINIKPKEEKDA
jgi:hypothetical protein